MSDAGDHKPVRPVRPANKRGVARLGAVQALYQMDISGSPFSDVIAEYSAFRLGKEVDEVQYLDADEQWFRKIVTGVVEHQRKLDPYIHTALAEDWPLKRIDNLLRAILRAGAYELLDRKDVPVRVVLSEYIDVAKAFYEDEEPRLVNGVLDRLAHELRADELDKKSGSASDDSKDADKAD